MKAREVRVSRADLLQALVRRTASEQVEGQAPAVTACLWCGKLVARSKSRPRTPRRFCRAVPPKKGSECMWRWQNKQDQIAVRMAAREDGLVGPSGSYEDFLEWSREVERSR